MGAPPRAPEAGKFAPRQVEGLVSVAEREGRWQVSVGTPNPQRASDPITREAKHCYLRPFDVALRHGEPLRGVTHFILLDPGGGKHVRVLASVTTTRPSSRTGGGHRFIPGRLLIFPAWGNAKISRIDKGDRVTREIHHITVEEKASGVVSYHLSPPRSSPGTKERFQEAAAVKAPTEHGIHLFTLLVRSPQDLDIAGTAWERYGPQARKSASEFEAQMQAHLATNHALLEMPHGQPWRPRAHLQVHFILSDRALQSIDYPMLHVSDPEIFSVPPKIPENYAIRQSAIPIEGELRLVLVMNQVDGTPKSAFHLKAGRLHRRPDG